MRRQIFLVLIDVGLVLVATVTAAAVQDNFDISARKLVLLSPYLSGTALAAGIVVPAFGLSRSIWRFSALADYARTIPAVVAIVLGAVAVGFLFNRLEHVSRTLPVLQALVMICMLVGVRVAVRLYHARRRDKPKMLAEPWTAAGEAVVVIGINRIAELYLQSAKEFGGEKLKVVGLLGRNDRHTGWLLQRIPVLGVPEDAVAVLKELAVRGIFVTRIVVTFAFDRLTPRAQKALQQIEQTSNIKVDRFGERLLLDTTSAPAARTASAAPWLDVAKPTTAPGACVPQDDAPATFLINPATLQSLSNQPTWMAKRVFDIVAALLLLILCWPLFVGVGLLVAFDVGWPVTFWQQRPGLAGFNFKLFKFRTMAVAYTSRGERIPDAQRQTAIGTFLRRSRLDELPQILHILHGQMSFVGPRPLLPADQSPMHAARLLVRPGLTGWAQVKGGRGISAADKAALDVWYVRHASLRLDVEILLRTFPMLIYGEQIDEAAIRQAWHDLVADGICDASALPGAYR